MVVVLSVLTKLLPSELPVRYSFVLNPYPDLRISSCPYCQQKTGQRKIPLLIQVDPLHLVAFNHTCRYCEACDLLIADKNEIERFLTDRFVDTIPEIVGNRYLIVGTVEKTAWSKGMQQPITAGEMLPYACYFKETYKELRAHRPGWYKAGQEPPIMEPPPPKDWIQATNASGN